MELESMNALNHDAHLDTLRFLRSRDLVDQAAINRHRVAIVGVGAIGSQLAEQLARLGVGRFILLDPDVVTPVNLGVQGFAEAAVGLAKVHAVADRLQQIRSGIQVEVHPCPWREGEERIPPGTVIFAVPDAIDVRRRLYHHELLRRKAPCLFDARMSAEAFEAWCVPRAEPALVQAYARTLFPPGEAHRERCTARATIYCAALAAAALTAMFKRWAMREAGGYWHSRLELNLRTFDVMRCQEEFS